MLELTCKWITLANRYYYMYLSKALAPYGINTSQYLFIVVLCKEPGITQDKLPERIGINKSNVTRGLAQLEQAGFIRRETNPQDKRTTTVYPTQRARDIYPQIMRLISEWDSAATALITESPNKCPNVSFAYLNLSRSTTMSAWFLPSCNSRETRCSVVILL